MTPRRLQRVIGEPAPGHALFVGSPSKWRNMYRPGETLVRSPRLSGDGWELEGRIKAPGPNQPYCHPGGSVSYHDIRKATAEECVELFRRDVTGEQKYWSRSRPWLTEAGIRRELHGLNLSCWCPLDRPCHADVLLALANPEATVYVPGRDSRFEYAADACAAVESTSCALGCTRAGSPADIGEHGPGGSCDILGVIAAGHPKPVPEILDHGDRLVCTARQDPATAGMAPLFPASP